MFTLCTVNAQQQWTFLRLWTVSSNSLIMPITYTKCIIKTEEAVAIQLHGRVGQCCILTH